MQGAQGVLINITGGPDMTLFEVDEAANRIRDEIDSSANIIFGSTFDDKLEGLMRVSVVATGIEQNNAPVKTEPTKTKIEKDEPDLFTHALGETSVVADQQSFDAPVAEQAPEQSDQRESEYFIPPEPMMPQQQTPVMNNAFSEDFNTAPQQPSQDETAKPSFLKRFFTSNKKQQNPTAMQEQQVEYSNPYSNQSVQFNAAAHPQQPQENTLFAPSHFQNVQPQQPVAPAQTMAQPPQAADPNLAPQQQEQIANDNLAIPAFLRRQQKN